MHDTQKSTAEDSHYFQPQRKTLLHQSGHTSQQNPSSECVSGGYGRAARSSLPERGIAAEDTLPSSEVRFQIPSSGEEINTLVSPSRAENEFTSAISYASAPAGTVLDDYSVQASKVRLTRLPFSLLRKAGI